MFTYQEKVFLRSQSISEHSVFDGRNMTKAQREAAARAEGLWLILTDPTCRTAGDHRLRTTGGHCVQCNTAPIGYTRRHHESGYVYLAASPKVQLLKVGCAKDIDHRGRMLNVQRYAESDDWIVIAYAKTELMGKVEFDIHSDLLEISVPGRYFKDGQWQNARELFQGKLHKVWDAYRQRTAHVPSLEKWQIRDMKRFVFVAGH
jgi:hypothetical protein